MNRSTRLASMFSTSVAVGAAAPSAPAGAAPASPAGGAGGGSAAAVVAVKTGPLGSYLTDGAGRTLYVFTPDKTSVSTCNGGCATAWPAFTTAGAATATGAAAAGTLSTSRRTDGSLQVTYDGHPLYYFKADSAPGDTNGQGVAGVWFEVAPAGTALGAPAAFVVPKKTLPPATAPVAVGWS
jgi:predicted lipoprotein with Yx(FWY)xxD motif